MRLEPRFHCHNNIDSGAQNWIGDGLMGERKHIFNCYADGPSTETEYNTLHRHGLGTHSHECNNPSEITNCVKCISIDCQTQSDRYFAYFGVGNEICCARMNVERIMNWFSCEATRYEPHEWN